MRCQHDECKKKLNLMSFTCKCGKKLCVKHMNAEMHNCTFNYKQDGKEKLQIKLQKVNNNKIPII